LSAKVLTYLIIIEGRVFMAIGYKIMDPSGKVRMMLTDGGEQSYERIGAM